MLILSSKIERSREESSYYNILLKTVERIREGEEREIE
jgi:hypothetical protein